jgi:hypothetical protein
MPCADQPLQKRDRGIAVEVGRRADNRRQQDRAHTVAADDGRHQFRRDIGDQERLKR